MFVKAVKLAFVEAVQAVYEDNDGAPFKPRSVGIEYPEEEIAWPAILIQFRPAGAIQWTGLNPDEVQTIDHPDYSFESLRRGQFEGSIDFTILALSSAERDTFWDNLVQMVLMGDLQENTNRFHERITQHDLIGINILPTTVTPVGDSIGPGTPWDPDELTYEATLRVSLVGQFVADIASTKLVALGEIRVYPYTDIDLVPGEDDNEGDWQGFGT